MKLTKKHIGEMVQYNDNLREKGILVALLHVDGDTADDVILYHPQTKEFTTDHGNIEGWQIVAKDREIFNFNGFGYKEQAVKDLVKVLDKRYVLKKKK